MKGWLESSGPAICEVVSANDQDMIPRPSFVVRGDKKMGSKVVGGNVSRN